jgi:hypothetical protein
VEVLGTEISTKREALRKMKEELEKAEKEATKE